MTEITLEEFIENEQDEFESNVNELEELADKCAEDEDYIAAIKAYVNYLYTNISDIPEEDQEILLASLINLVNSIHNIKVMIEKHVLEKES